MRADFLKRDDLIQATWFAGTARALNQYAEKYYTVHDERIAQNMFIGKEQVKSSHFSHI
jgi:hypothetical protein